MNRAALELAALVTAVMLAIVVVGAGALVEIMLGGDPQRPRALVQLAVAGALIYLGIRGSMGRRPPA